MRKLFKIINLFLCFELIVGPLAPNLSFLSSKAFASDCGPGLHMDSVLNRCLTSAQTANIMNATSSCGTDDVECYRANAEGALSDKESKGEVKGAYKKYNSQVVNAAAVAVPITLAVAGLKHAGSKAGKCTSISYWALIAVSYTHLTL